MSKTLIDLDDEMLERAQEYLGTPTKKATVNAALTQLVERHRRIEALEQVASMDFLAAMADPEIRDEAWGR